MCKNVQSLNKEKNILGFILVLCNIFICLQLFTVNLWVLFSLSQSHRGIELSPTPHPHPTSLPWLGGCNLLQAAGQAERSPSYLDKGSPRKSYQTLGVFKYSCNCSNHFLLSLQPHATASCFKGPTLCFPYFLHQFFSPSTTTTLHFPMFSPPVVLQNTLPLPQHFLL